MAVGTIERAVRVELDPNNKQATLLRKACGARRFAWNWGLAEIEADHEKGLGFPTAIDLHKRLCALKKTDYPWFYEVTKCAPQEALRDLERAYKEFFKGKRRHPRFKKKGKCRESFRVYDAGNDPFSLAARSLRIPSISRVRVKESVAGLERALALGEVRIVSATVSLEADGRWFASLLVREERDLWDAKQDPSCEGRVTGIDLGLTSFAVGYAGGAARPLEIDGMRELESELRSLRRLNRKLARQQEGSTSWGSTKKRLGRKHARVRRKRNDLQHKLSTRLTKTNSVIVIETLQTSNMIRNKRLARRISDSAWGEFTRQLDYKGKWYGCDVIKADRFYPSTKTCSACGTIKESISLAERVFECSACGFRIDRDRNAARNLYRLGIEATARTTARAAESDAGGEDVRPVSRASTVKRAASTKPEPSSARRARQSRSLAQPSLHREKERAAA